MVKFGEGWVVLPCPIQTNSMPIIASIAASIQRQMFANSSTSCEQAVKKTQTTCFPSVPWNGLMGSRQRCWIGTGVKPLGQRLSTFPLEVSTMRSWHRPSSAPKLQVADAGSPEANEAVGQETPGNYRTCLEGPSPLPSRITRAARANLHLGR